MATRVATRATHRQLHPGAPVAVDCDWRFKNDDRTAHVLRESIRDASRVRDAELRSQREHGGRVGCFQGSSQFCGRDGWAAGRNTTQAEGSDQEKSIPPQAPLFLSSQTFGSQSSTLLPSGSMIHE